MTDRFSILFSVRTYAYALGFNIRRNALCSVVDGLCMDDFSRVKEKLSTHPDHHPAMLLRVWENMK
jgi:hypothetical protein